MKSHTDLEQSKRLAEILPLESADMSWTNHCYGRMRSSMTISAKPIYEYKKLLERFADSTSLDVFYPAWSLTALLKMLKDYQLFSNGLIVYIDNESYKIDSDNPIDACYKMIIKLHEQNIL